MTAIAAPATSVVNVKGEGGHAGAVLMSRRKDALFGAAEMVVAIERIGKSCPSDDLVVTVGELNVHPGAVNSIPREVRFTIDLRDVDQSSRDEIKTQIETQIQLIATERDLQVDIVTLNQDPPATAAMEIVAAIEHRVLRQS